MTLSADTVNEIRRIVREELEIFHKREQVRFHDQNICPCAICDELRKAK